MCSSWRSSCVRDVLIDSPELDWRMCQSCVDRVSMLAKDKNGLAAAICEACPGANASDAPVV